MQETQIWSLVQEDPTRPAVATEAVRHSYWAHVPGSPCSAVTDVPRSPHLEKALMQQQRPSIAKNK